MITPYGTLYIICNTYQYIVISKKDAEKVQCVTSLALRCQDEDEMAGAGPGAVVRQPWEIHGGTMEVPCFKSD